MRIWLRSSLFSKPSTIPLFEESVWSSLKRNNKLLRKFLITSFPCLIHIPVHDFPSNHSSFLCCSKLPCLENICSSILCNFCKFRHFYFFQISYFFSFHTPLKNHHRYFKGKHDAFHLLLLKCQRYFQRDILYSDSLFHSFILLFKSAFLFLSRSILHTSTCSFLLFLSQPLSSFSFHLFLHFSPSISIWFFCTLFLLNSWSWHSWRPLSAIFLPRQPTCPFIARDRKLGRSSCRLWGRRHVAPKLGF